MIALVQRTLFSKVDIDGSEHSKAGRGFLILLGVNVNDTEKEAQLLVDKTAKLRVFEDSDGKMNLSALQLKEMNQEVEIMVVSQFTLCAECKGQNRPSFISAARPDKAIPLYEGFVRGLREKYGFTVSTGVFGSDMKVSLLNDGPVTIILDTD
ncbi:MAG: D-tyrosyl-tRNA(Tyr) deacylase, partial [Clostridia bacterium]|nr:D-tyrosyl-tRNA(Tyr) deacylase [Clostridia bacterium]